MKKKYYLLAGLLVIGMVLASCAPSAPAEEAAVEEAPAGEASEEMEEEVAAGPIEVSLGISTDWATLDPFQAVNLGRLVVDTLLYERLFAPAVFGGELAPWIGKEYEQLDDQVVRVTIFDNIYDADGNHLTSSDVLFSFDTAKASGFFPKLNPVDEVTIVDEYTIDFKFSDLNPSILSGMLNTFDIVTEAAYEASGNDMATAPVGTNPYKVTDYVSGSSVTFEKVGDHWQTDPAFKHPQSAANPDKVTFKIIADAAQMAIALETGEIDVATSVDANEISRFMDADGNALPGYTLGPKDSNVSQILYFNVSEGNPFTNKDLRQAVLYAIDNEALVAGVLGGLGAPNYTFGSSVFPDFQEKWKGEGYYNHDLEKAQAALDASGVDPAGLSIRIMTSANPGLVRAAQIIQAELLEIGINAEILSYEEALYQSYLYDPTQWDIQLNTKGSGAMPSLWAYCFDARQYDFGTQNFVVDDTLQSLIEAVSGDPSPENMDAFHQYLKEEAYAYGMYSATSYAAAVDTVTKIAYYEKPFVLAGGCEFSADHGK